MPKSFLDFCKRAKSAKDVGVLDSSVDHTYVQYRNTVGYAIKENPLELSGSVITRTFPGFQGADMIVVSIKQVSKPIYENNDGILFHRDAPLKNLKASHIQLKRLIPWQNYICILLWISVTLKYFPK